MSDMRDVWNNARVIVLAGAARTEEEGAAALSVEERRVKK